MRQCALDTKHGTYRTMLVSHFSTPLARTMSIATVAEYVETEEVRARIATLGVDYGQGFAIGRPEPLVNLLAELPLLACATVVTPVLVSPTSDSQGGSLGDSLRDSGILSGILSVEFVY